MSLTITHAHLIEHLDGEDTFETPADFEAACIAHLSASDGDMAAAKILSADNRAEYKRHRAALFARIYWDQGATR